MLLLAGAMTSLEPLLYVRSRVSARAPFVRLLSVDCGPRLRNPLHLTDFQLTHSQGQHGIPALIVNYRDLLDGGQPACVKKRRLRTGNARAGVVYAHGCRRETPAKVLAAIFV